MTQILILSIQMLQPDVVMFPVRNQVVLYGYEFGTNMVFFHNKHKTQGAYRRMQLYVLRLHVRVYL